MRHCSGVGRASFVSRLRRGRLAPEREMLSLVVEVSSAGHPQQGGASMKPRLRGDDQLTRSLRLPHGDADVMLFTARVMRRRPTSLWRSLATMLVLCPVAVYCDRLEPERLGTPELPSINALGEAMSRLVLLLPDGVWLLPVNAISLIGYRAAGDGHTAIRRIARLGSCGDIRCSPTPRLSSPCSR